MGDERNGKERGPITVLWGEGGPMGREGGRRVVDDPLEFEYCPSLVVDHCWLFSTVCCFPLLVVDHEVVLLTSLTIKMVNALRVTQRRNGVVTLNEWRFEINWVKHA